MRTHDEIERVGELLAHDVDGTPMHALATIDRITDTDTLVVAFSLTGTLYVGLELGADDAVAIGALLVNAGKRLMEVEHAAALRAAAAAKR